MEPEPSQPDTPSMSALARRQEIRSVERWQGYLTCTFHLAAGDGTIYESEPFRWRRAEPPPDAGAARVAYDGLVERLIADGWTAHADGQAWCETSFARMTAVPVEQPAEPEVESRPVSRELRRVEVDVSPPPPVPVAPAQVPVTPAPPPALPETRPDVRPHRSRTILVAAAGSLVGAAVTSAAFVLAGRPAAAPLPPPSHHRVAAVHPVVSVPVSVPRRRPATVDVLIAAVRGDGSWIEARRGSSTGPVLFRGVLPVGRRLHLRGPRVWARFGAAANLAISVGGRPVRLNGTYDKLFRPPR